MNLGALFQPGVLALWFVVGLVAGMIGKKIFYRGRRTAGGGFGDLIKTAVTGMIGAAIGIGVGVMIHLPGASELGVMMFGLAIAGTLLTMFIVSLAVR